MKRKIFFTISLTIILAVTACKKSEPNTSNNSNNKVANPVFSVPAGTYNVPFYLNTSVINNNYSHLKIVVTDDGSAPTCSGENSSYEFLVSQTSTVKAIACADEMSPSDIVSVNYTIKTQISIIGGTSSPYSSDLSTVNLRSIATDNSNNLYVLCWTKILKFSSDGSFVKSINVNYSSDNADLVIDSSGNIFVVDSNIDNNKVYKYDQNGNVLTSWGGEGDLNGQFRGINQIARDKNNYIYITEYIFSTLVPTRIQKFDSNGNFISQITYKTASEQMTSLTDISINDSGNIFVTGSFDNYLFDTSGNFIKKIALKDNSGIKEIFYHLTANPNDTNNLIYAATYDNILIINSDGTVKETIAKKGYCSKIGSIGDLVGMAVDNQGNLYVADTKYSRIQKYKFN